MANNLVITLQPAAEFYKDEGGKSNFLTMIVTTPPAYIITGTVKLKATLAYDNFDFVEVSEPARARFPSAVHPPPVRSARVPARAHYD
jgi:hypothetical protein